MPLLAVMLPLLLWSSTAFPFELGRPPSDPAEQMASFKASLLFDREGYSQSSLSGGIPVWKSLKHGLVLNGKFAGLDLRNEIPDYDALATVEFGAAYTGRIEEGKFWSLSGAYGSSSDRLFADSSVNTVNFTGMYLTRSEQTGAWLFLLNYSNQRSFLNGIPLPGFAYLYEPSRDVRGVFGAPVVSFFQKWPSGWSINLFTLVPWVIKGQLAYAVAGPVQVFTGAEWSQLSFLKSGRANLDERLIYDEKRVYLGVRSPLSQILFAEVEGGYAADRRIFEADGYTTDPDSKASRVAHLLPTPYVRLSLSGRW